MDEKKTMAVFIRSRRNGRDVLIRDRYNIVQYGTGDDAKTYVEGLPMREIRQVQDGNEAPRTEEIYDEILVCDSAPYTTRFGTVS
jgi:hypothetical protein